MMDSWHTKIKFFFVNSIFLRLIAFFIYLLGLLCIIFFLKNTISKIFFKKNRYVFQNKKYFNPKTSTTDANSIFLEEKKIFNYKKKSVIDNENKIYGELTKKEAEYFFTIFFKKLNKLVPPLKKTINKKITLSKKNQRLPINLKKNSAEDLIQSNDLINCNQKLIKNEEKKNKKELSEVVLKEVPPLVSLNKIENKTASLIPKNDSRVETDMPIDFFSAPLIKAIHSNEIIINAKEENVDCSKEVEEMSIVSEYDKEVEAEYEIIKSYENRLIKYLLKYPGKLIAAVISIEYLSQDKILISSDSKAIPLALKAYLNQIIKLISIPYFLVGKKITILL